MSVSGTRFGSAGDGCRVIQDRAAQQSPDQPSVVNAPTVPDLIKDAIHLGDESPTRTAIRPARYDAANRPKLPGEDKP